MEESEIQRNRIVLSAFLSWEAYFSHSCPLERWRRVLLGRLEPLDTLALVLLITPHSNSQGRLSTYSHKQPQLSAA